MARRAERKEPPTRVLPPEALLGLVRGLTEIGGATWIRVTGISMNPLLRDGDSVLIGPIGKKLRRGRVVFMDVNGSPILHRVCRLGTSIVARGDASRHDDAPVSVDNCVGLAMAVRRDGVLIALIPTFRFGLMPLIRYAAWSLRLRVFPEPLGGVTRPLSRAIGRALT